MIFPALRRGAKGPNEGMTNKARCKKIVLQETTNVYSAVVFFAVSNCNAYQTNLGVRAIAAFKWRNFSQLRGRQICWGKHAIRFKLSFQSASGGFALVCLLRSSVAYNAIRQGSKLRIYREQVFASPVSGKGAEACY